MSVQDAAFLHVEDASNPMHIGSVSVLEGPAPAYGDIVRLISSRLDLVPRYRQKVRFAPAAVGRPVWVDDRHFQILYHIRHTAIPPPGGRDELRNLAGRVFAQMLDRSKPLWELWMVEGLAGHRWALISKVHHCMVDGISATDLLTVMFDSPGAPPPGEPMEEWEPEAEPGPLRFAARGIARGVAEPAATLGQLPGMLVRGPALRQRLGEAADLARSLAAWSRPPAASLNGPIGPHRRWSWAEASLDDVERVRRRLGGTVNDVVLAAITSGFRTLLLHRGEDVANRVVRTLVPVSVRAEHERGALNNRVSGMFPGLPVSISDPVERFHAIAKQLATLKQAKQAAAGDTLVRLAGIAPPMLAAIAARLAARTPQHLLQTVATNIPGPRSPLYVDGRRMVYSYPYVPILGTVRIGVATFSYCGRLFFGITGDYDSVSDIDVLRDGIEDGIRELVAAARERAGRSRSGEAKGSRQGHPKATPREGHAAAVTSGPGKR